MFISVVLFLLESVRLYELWMLKLCFSLLYRTCLDSAVSPLASDIITMDVSDEKCAHPSDLPSAVDVGQSDNGNPEHLGSVAVNGAIGNEGHSGMDCSEQTDDGKFIVVDDCISYSEDSC